MASERETPLLQKRLDDLEDLSDYIERARRLAERSKTYILLTERKTADLLAIEPTTLRTHRVQGKPPCFYKIGKTIRYNFLDLVDYIENSHKTSTSE